MVAIGGDDPIFRLAEGDKSCADGFLANVEVEKTADKAFLIEFGGAFFNSPDKHHLAVELQMLLLLHSHNCSYKTTPGMARHCGCSA